MADEFDAPAPRKRASAGQKTPAAETSMPASKGNTMTQTTTTPTTPSSTGASGLSDTTGLSDTGSAAAAIPAPDHRGEAKSRFNAAVSEAKAGAAALKAEATQRAGVYREQAGRKSQDWVGDAKAYGQEAKTKGRDLATQGKGKVTEGLTVLGQTVADNAHVVDEKLGAKYGDYARSASRSIQDAATRLDAKSIDELGEDARQFVRKSPGAAVGIAAVVGFMLSRLFTGSRR